MAIDWTTDRIKTLMALWTEGVPTLEIGRRLGVTKNSVVGKVHRLGLPKRQSPISSSPRTPRAAKPTPPIRIRSQTVSISENMVKMEELTAEMCRWPVGDPGQEDFRFCGQTAIEGKPYCEVHCARAYVRGTRDRIQKPLTTIRATSKVA